MDMEMLMKMLAVVAENETSTDESEYAKGYKDGYEEGYDDGYDEALAESDDYEEEETSCGCSCEMSGMPAIVVGASDLADLKRAVATIEKMLG